MRPVAMPDFVAMSGVFIERRPIIGVAAVEEPPGDGAGYMDDLDTIRRCSSGSQWDYLAGIGKFMAKKPAWTSRKTSLSSRVGRSYRGEPYR